MDIVITGRSALMLHRIMREKWPKLAARPVPTDSVAPTPLHNQMLRSLNTALLEGYGLATIDRPLDLSVASPRDRAHLPEFVCHVRTRALPGGSLLQLRATKRHLHDFPLPSECRVFIDSIPLVIATQAGLLQDHISDGRLTRAEAICRLVQLICEFAGTYGRDAFDPKTGEVGFELKPLVTVKEVSEYLNLTSAAKGIPIARSAARLAVDDLASPMELLVYASLAFPPRLGGLHIKDVKVNKRIDLSDEALSKLGVTRITPDFRVGDLPFALEYNGEEHLEKYRVRKDKRRSQVYARLGYRHYPIMKEDVLTVGALEQTLRSIVDILSENLGRSFRTRVMHILRDDGYHESRMQMLERLSPPMTRRVGGWDVP